MTSEVSQIGGDSEDSSKCSVELSSKGWEGITGDSQARRQRMGSAVS